MIYENCETVCPTYGLVALCQCHDLVLLRLLNPLGRDLRDLVEANSRVAMVLAQRLPSVGDTANSTEGESQEKFGGKGRPAPVRPRPAAAALTQPGNLALPRAMRVCWWGWICGLWTTLRGIGGSHRRVLAGFCLTVVSSGCPAIRLVRSLRCAAGRVPGPISSGMRARCR